MRIVNKTNWRTDDLRRLFSAVLAQWNKIDDLKVPSKRLCNIKVVPTRTRQRMSGCAYVNSGWMTIRLPTTGPVDIPKLGFLFEHELAHCAGYHHNKMGPLNHWTIANSGRYAYLDGMTISAKEAKPPKPQPDKQIERYQSSVAALARWRTKLKRAQTGMKTHQARVRRYEKIFSTDGRLAALKP